MSRNPERTRSETGTDARVRDASAPRKAADARAPKAPAPGVATSARIRWIWTAVLLVTTLAPYLYWWLRLRGTGTFLWILPPYPEDSLAYLAWERQALNGALLFSMKYTALPHAPFLFQPFFLVVGWLSRLTHIALPLANLLAKAAGTVLFVQVWFRFTETFRLSRAQAAAATAMLAFASGWGGYLAGQNLSAASADLWLVDLNTWWSLLWNSLFPLSLSLILEATTQGERALSAGTAGSRAAATKHAAGAGLMVGLLALVHPYQVPMLTAWCALRWIPRLRARALRPLAAYALVCAPPAVYVLAMEKLQPLLASHSLKGNMQSPALPQLVSGLGLPLLLALAGLFWKGARRSGLSIWLLLSLLGAYLPVWFQRKMLFGLHPVVCAMAGLVCGALYERLRVPRSRALAAGGFVLALALMSFSNLVVLRGEGSEISRAGVPNPYLVDPDHWNGLQFLRRATRPQEVVLASPGTSRLIPAISGNTAFWGHWAQAVDFEQRGRDLQRLLDARSGLDDRARAQALSRMGTRYVMVDSSSRPFLFAAGTQWLTARLRPLFQSGDVAVYRFEDAPVAAPAAGE